MKCDCGSFDCKSAAAAIGRWALGMLLLMSGLAKFPQRATFAKDVLLPMFAQTRLPPKLVLLYGQGLPYAELILGILLITGYMRGLVLTVTGLLFISLSFGQIILQKPDAPLPFLFACIILTVIMLSLCDHDRWALGRSKKKEQEKPQAEDDVVVTVP